jgi:hypothetical protein
MLFRYAIFSLAAFAATPALSQQPARAAAAAEAADTADVVGDLIEKVSSEESAAEPRVGVTVRAATGAPVGQVAGVTEDGVVLRLQVKDRPALKLIAREHLELKGEGAVTDLTLSELQRLPDVALAAE